MSWEIAFAGDPVTKVEPEAGKGQILAAAAGDPDGHALIIHQRKSSF